MKSAARPIAYVVLLVLTVVFFTRFRAADRRDVSRATARALAIVNEGATNDPAERGTNLNTSIPVPSAATASNASPVLKPGSPDSIVSERADHSDRVTAITDMSLFIGSLIVLGILGAWDVSQYFGGRAGQTVMAENYLPPTDPDYEAAEAEWAKGNHMDALNLMREYLRRNPSEQHVAIRISEIYEKDLNNYLAAALELEDVLQKRLPREKWGWTAIHLANLYSGRLNQSDKALGVLNRIVRDYADTAAARKARQRLGLPEPEVAEVPRGSEPEKASRSSAKAPVSPPTPPEENPALPRGFRAKK